MGVRKDAGVCVREGGCQREWMQNRYVEPFWAPVFNNDPGIGEIFMLLNIPNQI